MLRRLKLIALALAVLTTVGLSTLVVLAHMYEDEVKAAIGEALNERLAAPVSWSGMDLTLLRRFPNASLRLQNARAMEVRTDGLPPDTLLHAQELFLEFSLWELFRGRYTVDRIHGTAVVLRPALDTRGEPNHRIWKESGEPHGDAAIDLREVSFDGLAVRFRDARNGLEVLGESRDLRLAGRVGGDPSEVRLTGNLRLTHWKRGEVLLLADRKAHADLTMTFGGADETFRIAKGQLNMGRMPLALTLDLGGAATGHYLLLRANGFGLPLTEVIAALPEAQAAPLRRYGAQGQVDLALRYEGPLDREGASLSIGAKLTRGRLKEKRSGAVLEDMEGEFAAEISPQGTLRSMEVKGFSATAPGGSIRGDWSSGGLYNAPLKANVRIDMELAGLLRFLQVDTLEQAGGRLFADARVEGRLRDASDLRVADLRALRIEGAVRLEDATLKVKGLRHRAQHLHTAIALHGSDATVEQLRGEFQGNALELEGRLRNLVPYLLFDDQRLIVEARARSPRIDLAALLRDPAAGRNAAAPVSDYVLSLPASIELDLRARVDELVFEDFTATDIAGTVRLQEQRLRAAPVTFNTAGGAVLGTLELDASGDAPTGHPIAIEATVADIDVTTLFREFRDFGQDFIGHRHLSGRARAHVDLDGRLSSGLRMDLARLQSTVDIVIENGAIRDHAPLVAVADHLRKNALVAPFVNIQELRTRLAEVRFARLENRIRIRDGAVHIPRMEVRSSVMDIELSGTHWFDDRIDHHVNFRLSDLFRIGKPVRDEFGPILDDGTGMRVFLRMYGTAGDPQFSNDGALAADRRRRRMQQEKDEMRAILRDDLGLGRRSGEGSETNAARHANTAHVRVEWDTATDTARTAGAHGPASNPAPPGKERKGLGKLFGGGDKGHDRDRGGERITVED